MTSTTSTALERVHDALTAAGCRLSNGGRASTCPAHEDNAPSLSIGVRDDRAGVLLKCHAGCDLDDILPALRLTVADLFDEPHRNGERAASVPSERPRIVASYAYTDEAGALLFEKVRKHPKTFTQRRPDGAGGWTYRLGDVRRVLYRLPAVRAAVASGERVWVAEGEKDADALQAAGMTATTWTEGAWRPGQTPKWRPEYTDTLAGAHVVIVRDRDEAGAHTAATIAAELEPVAASLLILEPAEGKDVSDHLDAGRTLDELRLVDLDEPAPGAAVAPAVAVMTLDEAHDVFRRWLGTEYDLDALNAVLAAAAVERLDGDPLWLLLISGSGNAKTETVQALDGAGAILCSTITSEGALLSATSKREKAADATGGLLRRIGARGVLVVKDVTSILSMNRDMRAQVLGALREVYDGRWSRSVGTDGGQTLEWSGRVTLIGAVTTAWDKHHAVIASMGDRFVLVRMDSSTGRQEAGRRAIGNTGSETIMRAELAEALAGVLAGMQKGAVDLDADETDHLLAAADLVTLARTGVEYDYQGNVIDAHAPEMPTRFAKQLAQVVRGAVAIGVDRHEAMRLAIRCARDSMPPLRLAIIDDLAAHPDSTTAEVRKRLSMPRTTVDRQLQSLHMLGVLEVDEEETEHRGRPATVWRYRLADGIDPSALDRDSVPEKSVPTPNPLEEGAREWMKAHPPTDLSGTDLDERPRCAACGRRLGRTEAAAGTCLPCQRIAKANAEAVTA